MLNTYRKNKVASLVCLAIATGASANVHAAENDKETDVEVIEVRGVRSSLTSALAAKRDAESISDSIIAEEIGKSSDENIAQALSRVSGISLDRNGGDGQTVTVRGVEASLNDIKLNGVSMTSNTDSQAVDLSLFSADILSRIDVVKSPAANQEEGSLGASINLQTRAPLSVKKNTFVVSAEARHSTLMEDTTPRFSANGIVKFSDTFGVAASLFHDQQNVRKDEFNTNGWYVSRDNREIVSKFDVANGEPLSNDVRTMIPNAALARLNEDEKTKKGGTITFQLQPAEDTDIRFDASFSRQEVDHRHSQNRFTQLHRNSEGDIQLGDSNTANTVVNLFSKKPGVLNQAAEWLNTTDTLVLGLQVEQHLGDNWTVKARVGHSDTQQEFTDSFRVNWWAKNPTSSSNDRADWCGISYVEGPEGDALPEFSHCAAWNMDDPSDWTMGQALAQVREVDDTKSSAYIDFTHYLDSDLITSIEFGAKYTDRSKSVTAEEVKKTWKQFDFEDGKEKIFGTQLPGLADSSTTGGEFLDGIAPDGFPTDWLYPDVSASINLAFPEGTDGLFQTNPLSTWEVEEKTYGGYVQANYELLDGEIMGNLGVRYAKTEVVGHAHSGVEFPAGLFLDGEGNDIGNSNVLPVSDEKEYDEWLPSFTLNYVGFDDVVVRASAARVMARPNINFLNPSFRINARNMENTPTGSGGNTQLDPFVADQADLSFEWYFDEGAVLSTALFYKDFKSFTFSSKVDREVINPITGTCVVDRSGLAEEDKLTATEPCALINYGTKVNGASAEIKGAEFMYQQHFTFLPGLLSHLGTSFNYTYADSEAIVDPSDENNPFNGLPFVSTSKHSSNTTLYWEDEDLSLRLVYAYRSKAMSTVQSGSSSVIRDDRGTLDFSANYSVTKKLKLSFSATNLTNSYDRFFNVLTDPADSGLTDEFDGDVESAPDGRIHKIYKSGINYRLSMRYTF